MQKKIEITYKEFSTIDDLEIKDKALLLQAEESMAGAYAPYSKFKVGAAVLLKNGLVFTGNNQENMAYPSGLCAERVALFYAASQHKNIGIKAIAIAGNVVNKKASSPITPCGACRQVMLEYERLHNQNIKIIMGSSEGIIFSVNSVTDLLPFSFFSDGLEK